MALSSISLKNGATVIGRVLARNGQVSLINNVLDSSRCGTGSSSHRRHARHRRHRRARPARPAPRRAPAAPRASESGQRGRPTRAPTTTRNGTTTLRRTPHATCTSGFRAEVKGKLIKRVMFRLDGKRIAEPGERRRSGSSCGALPGAHTVTAHVTFKDATEPRRSRSATAPARTPCSRPPPAPRSSPDEAPPRPHPGSPARRCSSRRPSPSSPHRRRPRRRSVAVDASRS